AHQAGRRWRGGPILDAEAVLVVYWKRLASLYDRVDTVYRVGVVDSRTIRVVGVPRGERVAGARVDDRVPTRRGDGAVIGQAQTRAVARRPGAEVVELRCEGSTVGRWRGV